MQAIKAALGDVRVFSAGVLGMELYGYQAAPLLAVVQSVLRRQGREFLLVFPRQSGKNEAVAHLLVYLLNLLQQQEGQMVYAAIGDGLGRGMRRLEARLENPLNKGRWRKGNAPLRRSLGKASVVFVSSHPQAYSRGETAHWLLVVDELQDQDGAHLEAVFEPMRAAGNATALYLGTVRFRHDALWQKMEALQRLEAADGIQRVFMVPPETVCAVNPGYAAFLAGKERRLGRDHPIVQSEYYLQPVDGVAALFPPRRLALMRGTHGRQRAPEPGRLYVATLDVAGQDEGATDPIARLTSPGRDYTVCTVFEVVYPVGDGTGVGARLPVYRAVDVFADQGSRHFQDVPGQPALVQRLLAFVRHWGVGHVIADATGVGEGLVDWLAGALGAGRVTPFKFSPFSKGQLGSRLLSVVETGRFRHWGDDGERAGSDGWWFWQQAAGCTYALAPGAPFERALRWGVPAGVLVETPGGRVPLHDDRLLSAALIAHYDALLAEGTVRAGAGEAAVVGP